MKHDFEKQFTALIGFEKVTNLDIVVNPLAEESTLYLRQSGQKLCNKQ